MLPPPEASYPNDIALMRAVREFAHEQGYAVSKLHSDKRKIVIKCDRGGSFRSRAASGSVKKRESATRLVNCSFRLTARLQKDGTWIFRITVADHNYEPSSDMRGHTTARRLNSSQRITTRQLLKLVVPPKQILNCLREEDPTVLAAPRNIFNERRNYKDDELIGQTSLEALLDDLYQPGPGWSCQTQRDGENRLTHLFFSCPQFVELLRRYPYTLVIDCTYKNNRFKMPLLHIIGTTSFNTSFSVAFAFLRYEHEHDCYWALENIISLFSDRLPVTITTDRELALMNSIDTLLPNMAHLLYVWHIQKNVLHNCRKYFGSEDNWSKFLSAWTTVIESPDTQSYKENVEKLREVYSSLLVMLSYISGTWLIYKEKFVHAYTNNYFHLGNLTSSCTEGMHHMVKSYIQVSTRDLRDVHARIYQAIPAQVANHSALLFQERIRVFQKHRIALFTHVVRHISTFVLDKVLEQYNLIPEPSDRACAQVLKNTMGLPCQHRIQYLLENNEPLTVNEFHPIWRLNVVRQESVAVVQRAISPILQAVRERYESLGPFQQHQTMEQLNQLAFLDPPLVNYPSVQQSRGRPSGSTAAQSRQARGNVNSSSNRRDPSAFEISQDLVRERRCATCRATEHNSRTCPQRVVYRDG